MIILLDSNYRNKSLYPNPGNYVIEINGTPPDNSKIHDCRGCLVSDEWILFSFQYFQQSPIFRYNAYIKNGEAFVTIFFGPDYAQLFNLYSQSSQNFLVGYEVVDTMTHHSAIIINSFKLNSLYYCILQNEITDQSTGELYIVNPSGTLQNNLLINGYSQYNNVPGQGFFQNEGVSTRSIIFNLTRSTSTSIRQLYTPFRNVILSDQDFLIKDLDYILVLDSAQKNRGNFFSSQILEIYPLALFSYSIVDTNVRADEICIGDVFISDFGISADAPKIPIVNNYLRLSSTYILDSPSSKIVLKVAEKRAGQIVYKIQSPGNQITYGAVYTLRHSDDPTKKIIIRCDSVYYCIKIRPIQDKDHYILATMMNSQVYFVNKFLSIPFYAVVQRIENLYPDYLVYIENPDFFLIESYEEGTTINFIDIYTILGFLNYSSFYPNMPVPLPNPPLACYEILLASISLPNLPVCGTNLLLADFPYVYVTFGNVTNTDPTSISNSFSIGSIISNNPYAVNATFLCPIANIRSPDVIKYVVVRSSQTVTAKLNLAENLRFSVYLPDGSLLKFSESFLVNYFTKQINASFTNCDNQNNLTRPTLIFPYNDYLSIAATFELHQL